MEIYVYGTGCGAGELIDRRCRRKRWRLSWTVGRWGSFFLADR